MLTSLRSRLNYARFLAEYAECVDQSFLHYYAIARETSKVTASQFTEFCRRIGAPVTLTPPEVVKLFDASRIEAVFEVEECAFDASKLRARMTHRARCSRRRDPLLTETEAVRPPSPTTLPHTSPSPPPSPNLPDSVAQDDPSKA